MAEITSRGRGRLKVLLGYAAGVGKTFQMLTEAHALKRDGVDVVIGYFEPHARKDTIALTDGLETVPTRTVTYRGSDFQEICEVIQLDLAAHPAQFFCHRGSVVRDLCPVFHWHPPTLRERPRIV